ncbi:MAG: glycosyltransferase family 2 protein [Bacteroidales bacterium]|nr:glycosyltransferase family 2 protein [Bacteroidales bacterium]
MKKLSIVITVFNEEKNIKPLIDKIFEDIKGYSYEIIFVDDGSTDNTVNEIKLVNDKRIKLIELKKNFGQSLALAAGIEQANGEYIVTMDGDLQNDPSDIPMMLKLAEEENWDLVAGIRANRQDGMFLRKIPSKIANSIIRKTTNVKIKDYGCTLKLFKSDIAKNLGLYGELHRFIPVLANLQGAKITQVNVKHHSRQFGESKYGINRTFKVMSDLILILFFKKYMQKPMHLFGGLGLIFFAIGIIIDFYLLVLKVLGQDIWGKPLLLLGIMLTLAGIQIITIGIVLEVMLRTYYESQDKKPYKIKSITIGEN